MAHALHLNFRPGRPADIEDSTNLTARACRDLALSRLRVGWLIAQSGDPIDVASFMSDAEDLLKAADAADRGEEIESLHGSNLKDLVQHADALVAALEFNKGWDYAADDLGAIQELAMGIQEGLEELRCREVDRRASIERAIGRARREADENERSREED
ncbi:MAG: hypothetical protein R3F35_01685 [Myxococcota bacterium]